MNIIDVIVIIIIGLCGAYGFKNGFVKQAVAIVGFILVFLISYLLKEPLAEWLSLNFPFFKFLGPFRGATILNVIIYQLFAFFIVFSILMVIYAVVVKISNLVEKLLKVTFILAIPSKIGGLVLGLIEGLFLSLIVIVFLSLPVLNFGLVRDSLIRNYLYNVSPIVGNMTGNMNDAIDEVMELKEEFDNKADRDTFNIKCFEVLLKHKLIGTSYSEKLVYSGKLDIDKDLALEIINKYK